MRKFSDVYMNMNKPLRWFLTNFGILAILLVGIYLQNPFLELVGAGIFWLTAIIGIVAWIIFGHFEKEFRTYDDEDIIFVHEGEEKAKWSFPKPRADEGKWRVLVNPFKTFNEPSVPHWMDIGFDVMVVILLAYLGYAWLPLFYWLHIFGLLKARQVARQIENRFPGVYQDAYKEPQEPEPTPAPEHETPA